METDEASGFSEAAKPDQPQKTNNEITGRNDIMVPVPMVFQPAHTIGAEGFVWGELRFPRQWISVFPRPPNRISPPVAVFMSAIRRRSATLLHVRLKADADQKPDIQSLVTLQLEP